MSGPDCCDDPAVTVGGGVDPNPQAGKRHGAWNEIKFDATCTNCGARLWAEYALEGVRRP